MKNLPEPDRLNSQDTRSPLFDDGYRAQVQMPSTRKSKNDGPITTAQIKLLQVARRSLGMEEQDYRNILGIYGGVASAKALTQTSFDRVMTHLKRLGFELVPGAKPQKKTRGHGDDLVTVNQSRKIKEFFEAMGWAPERQQGFCKKQCGAFWPQTREQASKLIEILKDMEARGYERATNTATTEK